MASPFPGMDPYLEGEMWQEFHQRLANQISAQLMPLLAPKYVALLARRFVLDRASLGVMGLPSQQRLFYPDVDVVELREATLAYEPSVPVPPTLELSTPMDAEVPILSVEVRDVAERRLVTVIEILSPVNKIGDGARDYLQRRQELMRTRTHLLEIDLLRRGWRIPLEGQLPTASYFAYLSRFDRRPKTEVWAITLRQRLPVVPVPLLPPDADAPLNLQQAVDACFALVGYDRLLPYEQPPPPPELSASDAAWVRERLQEAGLPAPT